ncbi:hypothetical protein CHLNCDRAFT_141629 [Chlorella variabilis]|uniref:FAS1 domain-containing protein n=1 Tax=Chlorella variabilis TaxID=554065 RepID=E1ZT73_CHLVA|nr:hypothetical protein CHLNCDRAFT_141629 [Chlorella variabilis]EFN50979.1 hypothetical protein CHLNCDRAFT_141629 [Chlorella variabilis]|eukprot:XP_005843081.1 hypothetical protein CHLNCDRAFT_141629 [Chlorella variabilis]
MPARTLQQVLPYSVAVAGLQPPSAFVPAAAPPGAAPGAARAAAVPAEAAGQPTCFPSIAAAIDGTPQLSILRTLVEVSGWNFLNPAQNVTLFAVGDAAQQLAIAGYFEPGREELQQLLGEVARDTRLLHASLAYAIAVGAGGLSLADLHQEGAVGVAGEWGNTTAAIVQPDIRTCGGSVIHVIDAGLTARTPLVEAYEAGTPVGELDLAAGSQGYSPAEAQAELDATGPASSAPAASSAPTASSAASSAAGQAPQAPPPPPPPAADGAAATDGGAAAAAPPAPAPREGQPPRRSAPAAARLRRASRPCSFRLAPRSPSRPPRAPLPHRRSHMVLRHAPSLSKLCLMSMGKLEAEAAVSTESDVAAVVASLRDHPSLKQVLLPSLDGHRSQLYIAALNVLIGISRSPRLEVRAVTYHGICNEWLDWLREQDAAEARR